MPNDEQIALWTGERGERWASEHERYDRMLRPFGGHVLGALRPSPGDRVLDVGCGNGALTLAIAGAVAPGGRAVGVDVSAPMLARARARAEEARSGTEFLKADAQVHDLGDGAYDAFVSRFGVMFFEDPAAAFANLARALRPGGRVAFVCWREIGANEWMLVPATALLQHVEPPPAEPDAPGPFSLADADRVTSLLGGAGLAQIDLTELTETVLVGTTDEAVDFYRTGDLAHRMLAGAPDDVRARALDAVAAAVAERAGPDGLRLRSSAWLVTAAKP